MRPKNPMYPVKEPAGNYAMVLMWRWCQFLMAIYIVSPGDAFHIELVCILYIALWIKNNTR